MCAVSKAYRLLPSDGRSEPVVHRRGDFETLRDAERGQPSESGDRGGQLAETAR